MNINKIISFFSTKTIKDPVELERVKKIILLTQFNLLGACFIFIFSVFAYLSDHLMLGQTLVILGAALIFNYAYLYFTGQYRISALVGVGIFGILSFYLIVTGGRDNTGPLWVYIFPLVSFYLAGVRRGFLMSLLLLGICGVFLFIPGLLTMDDPYSLTFRTRFMASITVVTLFALLYEFSRVKTQMQLMEMSQKYQKASKTDDLTGLPNRREMRERLKYEEYKAERYGKGFAVILCDIDHFKRINDTYGHDCGDFVLTRVAEILKDNLRKLDFLCRWGGEEFMILLVETQDLEGAALVSEKLRGAIESQKIVYNDDEIRITMSFGVQLSGAHENIDRCIKSADECLYTAKDNGRNCVVTCT